MQPASNAAATAIEAVRRTRYPTSASPMLPLMHRHQCQPRAGVPCTWILCRGAAGTDRRNSPTCVAVRRRADLAAQSRNLTRSWAIQFAGVGRSPARFVRPRDQVEICEEQTVEKFRDLEDLKAQVTVVRWHLDAATLGNGEK